jgi:hypothetical protein
VLAQPLAELKDAQQVDAVIAALAGGVGGAPAAAEKPDAPGASPLLALKDAELQRARDELARAREASSRADQRGVDGEQRAERAEAEVSRLRGELERLRRERGAGAGRDSGDRELQHRVHELEQDRDALLGTDEALRRQLAVNQSRLRELEAEVAELEALLPKGRRRKKAPEPPAPAEQKRFRLPYFTASFYKSLVGKERKSVERALQAILLFCTEGHAYPGLEVKQLGGLDTWSLRASLGLRVYFTPRPDGDVEFVELADREEQHTTLRRLKER